MSLSLAHTTTMIIAHVCSVIMIIIHMCTWVVVHAVLASSHMPRVSPKYMHVLCSKYSMYSAHMYMHVLW